MSEELSKNGEGTTFVGELKGFRVTPFIEAANALAAADEPERALLLLDNLPGYYRDNVPKEVTEIRNDIYKGLMNAREYIENPADEIKNPERFKEYFDWLLRGKEVLKDVKEANSRGITPHIVDMGPGDYWLPLGMMQHDVKFTYQPIALQKNVESKALKMLEPVLSDFKGKSNKWFVAYEVVEHIPNEFEVYSEFCKHGGDFERVYVSTPKYLYGLGHWDWRTDRLPHLRTYRPQELYDLVSKMFRGYSWTYLDDQIMLVKGIRNGT